MATIPSFEDKLDLREQIARIDKTQAEIAKIKVDTRWTPFQASAALMTAGAALLGVGVALGQLLLP